MSSHGSSSCDQCYKSASRQAVLPSINYAPLCVHLCACACMCLCLRVWEGGGGGIPRWEKCVCV